MAEHPSKTSDDDIITSYFSNEPYPDFPAIPEMPLLPPPI
jgi:hypothetical protein